MTTDELNVRLTADTDQLTRQLNQAGRDVTHFGETSEHAIGRAANGFDRLRGSISSLGVGRALGNLSTPIGELRYSLGGLAELFEAYAESISLEPAEEEVEELEDVTDDAATTMLERFDELREGVTALGIGAMLKEVVTAAGELEQNLGGSSAVFKEYAASLQEYAAQAYQTMGLSQSQYLATANRMGALFQGSGFSIAESVDMTSQAMQRAADVASIMGVDICTAMEAVSGAAKGNFTMMDNLGVAINDTTLQIYAQEKGLGKLETTQQKVNAAMMMFMENTEYAAGNYARENETFAGSLQTFKAELQNAAAEIGTGLLPVAVQGLQVLTSVLSDLKPVIATVTTGIGTIGEVLTVLENPAARGIAYAALASATLNRMTAAIGGTASGLILLGSLLTFVLGRYMETQQAAEETLSEGMDGAAVSTDKATNSTDKLNESLNEVGKTAKSLSAPFDEFTKLSGGGSSSLVSQLIGDNAEEEINTATESVTDFKNVVAELNSETVTPTFNYEKFKSDVESLGYDIRDMFFGTEEQSIAAMERINERITSIFGEEFTTFWEGVGADINKAFTGTDDERYQALKNLNDRIEQLPFGEAISETFQKLGQGLQHMVQGFQSFAEGDYEGAVLSFSEATRSVGQATGNDLLLDAADYATAKVEGDVGTQNIIADRYNAMAQDGLQFWNDVATGFDPTGLNTAWVDFWSGVGSNIAPKNIMPSPLSARDMNMIVNGAASQPAHITVNVKIDEETVGTAAVNYADGQVEATNGRRR